MTSTTRSTSGRGPSPLGGAGPSSGGPSPTRPPSRLPTATPARRVSAETSSPTLNIAWLSRQANPASRT